MSWQVLVALVIAIPVVLLPLAFAWYLNTGGVTAAMRRARESRKPRSEKAETVNGTDNS